MKRKRRRKLEQARLAAETATDRALEAERLTSERLELRRATVVELVERALDDAGAPSMWGGGTITIGQVWAPGCRYYADFKSITGDVRITSPELNPHVSTVGWERHERQSQPVLAWLRTEDYE